MADASAQRPRKKTAKELLEDTAEARRTQKYTLRLYVVGATRKSIRAIENLRLICEKHLKGRYDLEIIDIYKNPKLAKGDQIIAAPTLIKELPAPLRRLIGDLSDEDKVLLGLDLKEAR